MMPGDGGKRCCAGTDNSSHLENYFLSSQMDSMKFFGRLKKIEHIGLMSASV